ncbi:tetratricopeptide repeat protein [Pseudodesulfovibrio sp. JC047]|uniref:tetratricopeptide repeat protein n=1 Tax=Pseudodesulfovibrio sp. JC047 TaxID=2683199 RepID=UPI0013CF9E08|nr:tetratricopeptide repeat protein [Pseudodesulfovibrio sp. JC047]NDV18005.1 tetratricopeptide repeat protein [Pseudodesulfovibrio sp. JC047]
MTKTLSLIFIAFTILACAPAPKHAGNLSMTVKDYRAAAAYYEEALQQNPDSVIVLTNLGRAYYNLAEYDKAKQKFTAATQIQPGYPQAVFYLGLTALIQNDRAAGFGILTNFRYPGKPQVTRSVTNMARQLTDNTESSPDYLIDRMAQAWTEGMALDKQSDFR